eukprot:1196282-Prorocentrum_minimum.AAC.1
MDGRRAGGGSVARAGSPPLSRHSERAHARASDPLTPPATNPVRSDTQHGEVLRVVYTYPNIHTFGRKEPSRRDVIAYRRVIVWGGDNRRAPDEVDPTRLVPHNG